MKVIWRVVHAPLEAVSMVLNETASLVDSLTEMLYRKGYPDSWGSAGIDIKVSSNRQGLSIQKINDRIGSEKKLIA